MEDFKQYLSDSADAAERAAAEKIREGLAGLRLEAKVEAMAAERAALLRRRFWRRVALGAALVLVAGAILLFGLKRKQNAPPPPLEQNAPPPKQEPMAHQDPPPSAPTAPPDDAQEKKKRGPIAQARPADPLFPAPNVRGAQADNPAWQALLDQVWHTDYAASGPAVAGHFAAADSLLKAREFVAAYVLLQRLERAQPANDTLRYLKGYCLLEMGEGGEALRYFEKLESQQPDWRAQLDWYRGLSLLLAGEKDQALAAFRKIADQPRHPYRTQSRRAVQALD